MEHPAENAAVKLLTVVEQTLLLGQPPQGAHDQCRAHDLRKGGRGSRALDAPAEDKDEEEVERNIRHDADEQVVERTLGVAHRAQDAAAHVVEHGRHHAKEEDAQIGGGGVERFGRGLHPHEKLPRRGDADDGEDKAADHRKEHSGADAATHALRVPRAEVLRDDDARAGRECNESVDEQVGDTGRRAADRGERGLAERAADDDSVGGVVELLEQRAEHDRQREEQHPLPDAALRDGIAGGDFIFHKRSRLLIP